MFQLKKKHFGERHTAKIGLRFVSNDHWALLKESVANQEVVASVEALKAFLGPQYKVLELPPDEEERLARHFDGAKLTTIATGWIKLTPCRDAVQYKTEDGEKEVFLDRVYADMLGITLDGSVSWSGKSQDPVVVDNQAMVMAIQV